jgi:mRNA interferase RelE/StbE|tara:strand:- start:121 stop:375 length:255 start_codon:yes stop_codon:yes gene_type:complete
MYSILYSERAVRQLKKLPKEIRKRIISSLERCRIRPYNHIKRLIGISYFSLRVGDYRLIIDIKDNELKIFVIEVEHRKKVYKKI